MMALGRTSFAEALTCSTRLEALEALARTITANGGLVSRILRDFGS
jgi:hypothetical protein